MTNATNILLRHNYVSIPASDDDGPSCTKEDLATVLMNLSYYGYALNTEAFKSLRKLDTLELGLWWKDVERELKDITGESRKIADFVVYKNFPGEVLDKSAAEYWLPQILMYWGLPNELFTEEAKPREKMEEQPRCKVLRKGKKSTLGEILDSHLCSPARWKDQEFQEVTFLADILPVNMGKLAFKENMVRLATHLMESGKKVNISTGTDVLRLAAGLSDGDVSLREKTKFKSFKKPMRKFLLDALEECGNLEEDVARRPEMWKRLLHNLHPGDHARRYPRVCKVNDDLYHDRLVTWNSKVEALLLSKDREVLDLLSERPGEFRRRLVHTLDLFGARAASAFVQEDVLSKLTTAQVVSLRTFLETVNDRYHRVFPPKGNWSKVQVGEARWVEHKHLKPVIKALGKVLASRLPAVKVLDESTKMIKLPNNGEEGPYARGTVFDIPKDVDFIRTASYWKISSKSYVWYDNGWNFFDKDWKSVGACCWNSPHYPYQGWYGKKINKEAGAVFSGDPTNTKEMQGRAAQLIDLYPSKLIANGVRYAVWNILCYSRITFNQAEDVFAALQWGKNANTGKLFEPSRSQVQFPLKGDGFTKFIVFIDLVERKMIYLDANLKGNTSSAGSNGPILEKTMPAFLEYINSLPSVHDLFRESVNEDGELSVLYSDKDTKLDGDSAYVFRPENKENKYKSVDINALLE
jgi:hypothetical protein